MPNDVNDPTFFRFFDKVLIGDDCWEWQASVRANGYGQFNLNGAKKAHRVSYALLVGDIPNSLQLDHLCRNRRCVNPKHLEPVTQQENLRRGAAVRTACPQGHPWDEMNTYWYGGTRLCRACNRERQARRHLERT